MVQAYSSQAKRKSLRLGTPTLSYAKSYDLCRTHVKRWQKSLGTDPLEKISFSDCRVTILVQSVKFRPVKSLFPAACARGR